ncbi:inactive serine/threonine-protein kinase 19-like [Diadema antillarum]|uniref:inactive serine/threonine-protein kinase 19-like n=1 Tax=Diadema antillarum TaxID=105358 RepID=UPI003A8912BE
MKRSFIPSLYVNKRSKTSSHSRSSQSTSAERHDTSDGAVQADEDIKDHDLPSETKASLIYLKSLFNVHHFEERVPPIFLKHQLYSIIHCKTQVDKEVDELREKKEIKLFRFGKDVDEFCIVFVDDYCDHVRKIASGLSLSPVIERFLSEIIKKLNNITFTRQTLCDVHGFKDQEIGQLVNAGLLTARDVGSWWLSIPGAGVFMKNFSKGREAVLRAIRKSRYREILQKELEGRKLQAVKKLGMMYLIHDIIGAELVRTIKTTSGTLLRLDE